jgi:hypothetical protein
MYEAEKAMELLPLAPATFDRGSSSLEVNANNFVFLW